MPIMYAALVDTKNVECDIYEYERNVPWCNGSTHGEMSRPGSWGLHLTANRGVCVQFVAVQPVMVIKMDTKKPVLMNPGHSDEMFTPPYALTPLYSFIDKFQTILEPFPGEGHMADVLEEHGFDVETNKDADYDCLVTNPPYSNKDSIIEWCYSTGKPFALLLPTTALAGIRRGKMFREYGLQVIQMDRRVDFITPNNGKSSWFPVAWFTWGLNLPKDLMFVEMDK